MRFSRSLVPSIVLLGAGLAQAASSWGFTDATVSIQAKGEAGVKDKLSATSPLSNTLTLGAADTLKILLTTTESDKPKQAHQTFLLLRDQDTGLENSYAFSSKSSGKGKVELTHKDLPLQFLNAKRPLRATLVVGSFGNSSPLATHAFDIAVKLDPAALPKQVEAPLRYGKLPEIHHIFKADAKNPPRILSLVFVMAIIASVFVLFGAWQFLDANLEHLPKAISAAPLAHTLFFGSIVAMEGIFFMYYSKWTLFQTLPAAGAAGLVAFLSGSKALSEVQTRRFAGER